jgi:hypothetical protein
MKAPKNFEALFLAAALMATVASYATAAVSTEVPLHAAPAAKAAPMQVVVIKGHRLSAAEKAAL